MKRVCPDANGDSLLEAPHVGKPCWPAIEVGTGSILLIGIDPFDKIGTQHFEVWRGYAGAGQARMVFDWMSARPSEWPLWGRISILFGEAALRPMIITAAERAAEVAAKKVEMARLEEEARVQLHSQIELFVRDAKGHRPGLSLKSRDESSSFFVMRFSERWERERVLDWLRWQKDRFIAFRDLHEIDGSIALERLIIADMRKTEARVKAQGVSSGGRRPLRFWRGES